MFCCNQTTSVGAVRLGLGGVHLHFAVLVSVLQSTFMQLLGLGLRVGLGLEQYLSDNPGIQLGLMVV